MKKRVSLIKKKRLVEGDVEDPGYNEVLVEHNKEKGTVKLTELSNGKLKVISEGTSGEASKNNTEISSEKVYYVKRQTTRNNNNGIYNAWGFVYVIYGLKDAFYVSRPPYHNSTFAVLLGDSYSDESEYKVLFEGKVPKSSDKGVSINDTYRGIFCIKVKDEKVKVEPLEDGQYYVRNIPCIMIVKDNYSLRPISKKTDTYRQCFSKPSAKDYLRDLLYRGDSKWAKLGFRRSNVLSHNIETLINSSMTLPEVQKIMSEVGITCFRDKFSRYLKNPIRENYIKKARTIYYTGPDKDVFKTFAPGTIMRDGLHPLYLGYNMGPRSRLE